MGSGETEGEQSGQTVQFDLGRVQGGVVHGRVGHRAHQQAQRREVGSLGAGLLGELLPPVGGPVGGHVGGFVVHTRFVPAYAGRKW